MSQVSHLPEWAQRLHAVLQGSRRPIEELYVCLDLEPGKGWLGEALAGIREPDLDYYALLSGCSGVPLSVLTGQVPAERSLSVALRAGLLHAPDDVASATCRAKRLLSDCRLLVAWQPHKGKNRRTALEEAKRACSGSVYPRRAGRATAERLRDLLELDDLPVKNLVEAVEGLGVPVIHEPLPSSVHGLTVRDDAAAVILINTSDYPGRQRYTLAHELCHVLYGDGGALIVDRDEVPDTDASEVRAEAFARHFLAPDNGVRTYWRRRGADAGTDFAEAFARLILDFGISRQAAAIALREVTQLTPELIGPYTECSVNRLMRDAGYGDEWSAACEEVQRQRPSPWLLEMALNAYADGLVGPSVVANQLKREDETDAVEYELMRQGWHPPPTAAG